MVYPVPIYKRARNTEGLVRLSSSKKIMEVSPSPPGNKKTVQQVPGGENKGCYFSLMTALGSEIEHSR